jgi:uncharacterized protein YndB with AHSA1/START domain
MTRTGTFEEVDGRPAVRFERRLRHPVGRVWRALTDAGDLAQWFPDTITVDAWEPGAPMRFENGLDDWPDGDGEVLAVEPERRLVFRWYGNEVRFELEPDGDGSRLRLTALLDEREAAARDAAGWHVCLDRLERAVDRGDATAPGPEPTDEWRTLFDGYVADGLPAGARLPG